MSYKKQLKINADDNFWDKSWENYDIEKSFRLIKYYKAYRVVSKYILKNCRILEAGCGVSQWVHALHHDGFLITGIDYAKKTVSTVNKKYPELDVISGDIFNLNFVDKSIDTYLSWGVMEHYEEGPNKILSEAHRVLKDDGTLILTVPYLNILRKIFIKDKSFGKGKFYQYIFGRRHFTEILNDNGFEVIENYKLNWIKGFSDLIFMDSDHVKQTKKNKSIKKTMKESFLKKTLRILFIKFQDFNLLTNISGHMIMFIVKKNDNINAKKN